MSKQIPWLRVLVEGVVIVGSILLAFGLQAWWEGRQERAQEADLIVRLEGEFRENRLALEEVLSENLRFGEAALTIGGMDSEGMRSLGTDSLRTLFQGIGPPGVFHPRESELTSMVQSGEFRLLQSRDLRATLSRWTEALDVADEQANHVRRLQIERTDIFKSGGFGSARMRDEEAGSPDEIGERRAVLADLLQGERFRENILWHRLTRNYYSELLEEAKVELDAILALLSTERAS